MSGHTGKTAFPQGIGAPFKAGFSKRIGRLTLDLNVIEALRRKFPKIVGPSRNDICYATQNRQAAVKRLANDVDVLLVIGSANSSNAIRLVEVAQTAGTRAYLLAWDVAFDL